MIMNWSTIGGSEQFGQPLGKVNWSTIGEWITGSTMGGIEPLNQQ